MHLTLSFDMNLAYLHKCQTKRQVVWCGLLKPICNQVMDEATYKANSPISRSVTHCLYKELCSRRGYLGQGQMSTPHSICGL